MKRFLDFWRRDTLDAEVKNLTIKVKHLTTEIARTDKARKVNLAVLIAVLEQAGDAIIVSDRDGAIRLANNEALDIFGYNTFDEIMDVALADLMPAYTRNEHTAHIEQFFHGQPTILHCGAQGEFKGLTKDGRLFPISLSISLCKSNGDKYAVHVIRDENKWVKANERRTP